MTEEISVKQTLLEIAIATIDESGEPGIRVGQIVEAAGVTIPTLYHYFGSREGLIEAAQAERFIRILRSDSEVFISQLETCETRHDLEQVLANLIHSLETPERALMRWQRLNALGATYARPSLAERITKEHDQLVTRTALALGPFQRKGLIRQDIDLRAVVAWYNGAVLGKNLVQIGSSEIDRVEWDRTLLEATFAVLFGTIPPTSLKKK